MARAMLLICDVQERFAKVIFGFPHVVDSCQFLVGAAASLGVPVHVTEQYPKGLGRIVPELRSMCEKNGATILEKSDFSMWSPALEAELQTHNCNHVILAGLETHVCVLQTCLDISGRGNYKISVVVDAVSSSRAFERAVALKRLADVPRVSLTSCESIVFQLLGSSAHPQFKTISAMVKERSARLYSAGSGSAAGSGTASAAGDAAGAQAGSAAGGQDGAAARVDPVLCTLE